MMNDYLAQSILLIITSAFSSSGLFAVMIKRMDRKSDAMELLLGLAHDRIVWMAMNYIERGWITKDEYDDFVRYLYKPYEKFGGNGLADKMMEEIKRLPIMKQAPYNWKPETPYDKHKDITDYGRDHKDANVK